MSDIGDTELGSGNSIEELLRNMYGSQDIATPSENMVEEQAREEARRLAKLEEEIIGLIREGPRMIDEPGIFVVNNDISLTITVKGKRIQGLGKGTISFSHLLSGISVGEIIGVNTPSDLEIGIHTDPETRDLAEKAADTSEEQSLGTRYYFNGNGDHGKATYAPLTARETNDRSRIHERPLRSLDGRTYTEINYKKWVPGKMTAGDFEIAGVALGIIKSALTAQNPTT